MKCVTNILFAVTNLVFDDEISFIFKINHNDFLFLPFADLIHFKLIY